MTTNTPSSRPESTESSQASQSPLEQFPLEIIYNKFARMFRLTASNAVRQVVDITPKSTEVIPFGDVIKTLSVPASMHLFQMMPFQGNAVMVFENRLVFTLLDIFFGGGGKFEVKMEGRDFTEIEQQLMQRVVTSALHDLEHAWKSTVEVKTQYFRSETNPQFIAIVPNETPTIVTQFEVDMGKEPMHITLVILEEMLQLPADTPTSSEKPELTVLKDHEADLIAQYFLHEHPQTTALALSYLPDETKVAKTLELFPEHLQTDVIYRMSAMEGVPSGVIRELNKVLAKELDQISTIVKHDGIEWVGKALKKMNVETRGRILSEIENIDPTLANTLRAG